MCAVVKTDGGVPVYEDYEVAINLSSDMDQCLLHSARHGRTGVYRARSRLTRRWCWLVTLPCHPLLKGLFQCNLFPWDAGVQHCIFSNHCRAAATQYCLDGILVTGETEQYSQLGNDIKQNVHLCVKREKNPNCLQAVVNNFWGRVDGVGTQLLNLEIQMIDLAQAGNSPDSAMMLGTSHFMLPCSCKMREQIVSES